MLSSDEKRARRRAYYQAHKEHIKAYKRMYYAYHTEQCKEYSRTYYRNNRDKILAKQRAKREEIRRSQPPIPDFLLQTPEEKLELQAILRKEYYRDNRVSILKKQRVYYRKHRVEILRRRRSARGSTKRSTAKTTKESTNRFVFEGVDYSMFN